jgi:hypothetical protein
MKKSLIFFIILIVIIILIFLGIKKELSIIDKLKDLENKTGLNIEIQNKNEWVFIPKIEYKNNLYISNIKKSLLVENSTVNITKYYKINSPFLINFQSPSVQYKGINIRNTLIISNYKNEIINLEKITADIIDGNVNLSGKLTLDKKKEISIKGSYKNISLNRILKQLNIASWERLKIKISSDNFSLNSNFNSEKFIKNLNGKMNINGSLFFVSTEEERFGATFLSILVNKLKNMAPLSKSINYLLDKFADLPSNISGEINIRDGILITKNLLIKNKKEKALLSANLDLVTNNLKGKIDLYENDVIFLTVLLNGNIKNPEVLLNGKMFEGDNKKPQNIKEIFDDGIQSLLDNILNLND